MFGQALLSIIILLFLFGSISIFISIFTDHSHHYHYSPAKIKSNKNIIMNKPPSGALSDLDINNVFDDSFTLEEVEIENNIVDIHEKDILLDDDSFNEEDSVLA